MVKVLKSSPVFFVIVLVFHFLGHPNKIFAQDKAAKIDELMTKIVETKLPKLTN